MFAARSVFVVLKRKEVVFLSCVAFLENSKCAQNPPLSVCLHGYGALSRFNACEKTSSICVSARIRGAFLKNILKSSVRDKSSSICEVCTDTGHFSLV